MPHLLDHRGNRLEVSGEALLRREPGMFNRTLFTARLVGVLLLAFVGTLLVDPSGQKLRAVSPWLPRLVAVVMLALAWWVDRMLTGRFWWYGPAVVGAHTRLLLRHRRCPVCWYELSAVPPEPDGCTRCPECGGAWRLASTSPPEKA